MIKYTDENSPLKNQLIKLQQSFKSKNKSALIFRFVEVKTKPKTLKKCGFFLFLSS